MPNQGYIHRNHSPAQKREGKVVSEGYGSFSRTQTLLTVKKYRQDQDITMRDKLKP